jgi:Rrf2 family nitric oxide-sensitive transcriptional repressor
MHLNLIGLNMQIKCSYSAAGTGRSMRLTRYTDYSLRVLMHLALREGRLCSIGEIARAYQISHNHLTKVVVALGRDGFVETVRGRLGGIRLARPANAISVGEVVRRTEEGFTLADCSGCTLSPACGLTGVLAEGAAAMLKVFDAHTIADLLIDAAGMRQLIPAMSP